MKRYGLAEETLTNNVAESSNAIFKAYLNEAGIPNKSLEKKTTYEVLAATRCYLESEWQSLDRAYYNQGEFQVKERFRKYLLKKSDKLPGYDIPTANDQISEQIKLRKGTFLKKVYL